MTIQPSVVVWTVICFAALYFILKYLLFDPVLKLMDSRQKKISDAAKAKDDARIISEEKQKALFAEQEKAKQALISEREKREEKVHSEIKTKLENVKAESFAAVEEHRRKTETELDNEIRNADGFTDRAAALFLSRLFEKR